MYSISDGVNINICLLSLAYFTVVVTAVFIWVICIWTIVQLASPAMTQFTKASGRLLKRQRGACERMGLVTRRACPKRKVPIEIFRNLWVNRKRPTIPAVLQPLSTCQWFRRWLLTVCCQSFTRQPIVFLRCETNAYFIGSGCAGSLSFFFSGCHPRFSHLAALPLDALSRAWLTEEKRETPRSLLQFRNTTWNKYSAIYRKESSFQFNGENYLPKFTERPWERKRWLLLPTLMYS